MHGFALNLTTDLSLYDLIVPCGISAHGVTSIEALTKNAVPPRDAAQRAFELLAEGWTPTPRSSRACTCDRYGFLPTINTFASPNPGVSRAGSTTIPSSLSLDAMSSARTVLEHAGAVVTDPGRDPLEQHGQLAHGPRVAHRPLESRSGPRARAPRPPARSRDPARREAGSGARRPETPCRPRETRSRRSSRARRRASERPAVRATATLRSSQSNPVRRATLPSSSSKSPSWPRPQPASIADPKSPAKPDHVIDRRIAAQLARHVESIGRRSFTVARRRRGGWRLLSRCSPSV